MAVVSAYQQMMFAYERIVLQHALDVCGGHKGKAAAFLGISRKNFWEKLRRHKRAAQEEAAKLEAVASAGETA